MKRRKAKSAFAAWMDSAAAPTAAEIADALGVSVKTVYNYRRGTYRPSLEVILAIEDLTKLKVTAADWPKAPARARAS